MKVTVIELQQLSVEEHLKNILTTANNFISSIDNDEEHAFKK